MTMATIKWDAFLEWRDSKGCYRLSDIAIFIGKPCEVTNYAIELQGESLVQIQFNGKASFVIPQEYVEE